MGCPRDIIAKMLDSEFKLHSYYRIPRRECDSTIEEGMNLVILPPVMG